MSLYQKLEIGAKREREGLEREDKKSESRRERREIRQEKEERGKEEKEERGKEAYLLSFDHERSILRGLDRRKRFACCINGL